MQIDEAIIEFGGGASVLVDYTCREKFMNLSALDVSENAQASARKRLAVLGKKMEWF